jgi:hypothetical protein
MKRVKHMEVLVALLEATEATIGNSADCQFRDGVRMLNFQRKSDKNLSW